MKSNAATVEEYLASLPEDRRDAISAVRKYVLGKLGKKFRECMQYGVVGYCVPHSVWPHGHHTRPELALMYMGLSSQKNDMVVYMLFMQHDTAMREWFDKAWKATGKKSYLDVGGMGCCLRFKKLEELSLDVIGEAIERVPMKKYLADHALMLARIGKVPGGKAMKGEKKAERKPAEPARASVKREARPVSKRGSAARKGRKPS
jgi:hypothetical protein